MKTFSALVLALCILPLNNEPSLAQQGKYDTALRPYVEFLRKQNVSAKDYVINLFATKDIVVICERDHPDTTQYDLYLDIIDDSRFIANVGNVFTEVGVHSLNTTINTFLHAEGVSPDSANRTILTFHQNCMWFPFWEKENFSYLLRGIYTINQTLTQEHRINLYLSDMPFDWTGMDTTAYRRFWNTLNSRDSIMAMQVVHDFDSIQSSPMTRKKALVIMNYRHAFGHRFEYPAGKKPNNVGRYLFEKYGDRFANVLVNRTRVLPGSTDQQSVVALVQDGKWDASFKAIVRDDTGFDFLGSPFGNDSFDIWPWKPNPFKFEDVFDGFVFYSPIQKQRYVLGIPGIVDSAFAPEMIRRMTVFNTVLGRKQIPREELTRYCNERRIFPIDNLDSLVISRDRWLH